MLPLRWSLQATKIRFYLERRSLFPLCCFRFSFSPERVRLPATRACLAHFPLESSFKIKVSGREGGSAPKVVPVAWVGLGHAGCQWLALQPQTLLLPPR